MSEFKDFVRKQFPVQAARVTPMNIEELAEVCGGKIYHDGEKEGQYSRDYIKVRVAFPLNEEQTRARIGDWLVRQGRTFKVYKDRPFRSAFEQKDGSPVPGGNQKRGQSHHKNGPSPSNMPKKKPENVREEQEAFAVQQEASAQVTSENSPEGDIQKTVSREAWEADKADQIQTAKEYGQEIPVFVEDMTPEDSSTESPKGPSSKIFQDPEKVAQAETENTVAEAVESVPAPAEMEAKSSAEVLEDEPEKKPITLDELNERPGDPRTADDIHREGQQQG